MGNVLGRWERREGSELGRWKRWNGIKLEGWERWDDSKATRWERLEGSEVASWERWGASSEDVARWKLCKGCEGQGGKGRRVVKQQGGRFLVLFKSWEHWVTPRFHLFVSDVDQPQNEGAG